MGTVNLLEAVRQADRACVVVVITTDKCYENREWTHSYREDDPLGGHDPYSSSKGCAELVVSAYRRSFFSAPGSAVRLASARAGNVVGGGDWATDRIVPDCIRALQRDEPVAVRNPDAIRPWQHVLEPLSGYLWLAACMLRDGRRYEGAWNFGPRDTVGDKPVRWVVERFLEEWGSGSWTTPADVGPQPHEARHLRLDSAKARGELGWAPVWDARTAVRQTATWYREYYRAAATARALVEHQLRTYQDDACAAGLAWAADEGGGSTT